MKPTISLYEGGLLEYGVYDCNLMFLRIFEPRIHDKIRKRYKTVRGGVRVAKSATGYASIKQLLEGSSDYEQIPFHNQMAGDVIIYDKHDVIMNIGNGNWFLVDDTKTFAVKKKRDHLEDKCVVFRRV